MAANSYSAWVKSLATAPSPAPQPQPSGHSAAASISHGQVRISLADRQDRDAIYRMRHAVYATELGQHPENGDGRLADDLDGFNHYLVARIGDEVVGFVSVTPPGFGRYSIDKYIEGSALPIPRDDGLFECRILTVDARHRGSGIAAILMYAALRWVEDHGGRHIVSIGRRELMPFYERAGFRRLTHSFQSGAVTYDLMTISLTDASDQRTRFEHLIQRIRRSVDWALAIPFERLPGAFHGGASIGASRGSPTISADVLDAWFAPAPGVGMALTGQLNWIARTSPPTYPDELRAAIATARGVAPGSILPGAGLSDLIFRALPTWLSRASRVLLVEPQYAEYRHVLETVVGCRIDRIVLDPAERKAPDVDPAPLQRQLRRGYDLVIIVNPNNPLGYRFVGSRLAALLTSLPPQTMCWIDETYADFAGPDTSVEQLAAISSNVIVGKSMSKSYALSGLRVGYLCGSPQLLSALWPRIPPWSISRPAQVAAIAALAAPSYYRARYRETAALRAQLQGALSQLPGLSARRGVANYVFCDLLPGSTDAATLTERAHERGLRIRDFPMDPDLRWRAIRIAVGDRPTNQRIVQILSEAIAAAS